jgi:hypothetical protein
MAVQERTEGHQAAREAARFVFSASAHTNLAFEFEDTSTLPRADRAALGQVGRFWVHFSGESSLRGAIALRLFSAVNGLLERMDERALRDAGSGSDDLAALIAALTSPTGVPIDERDQAQLRGALVNRDLLAAEGGTIGIGEVVKVLGISRQAITQRVKRDRLLAVAPAGHRLHFPCWQFAEDGVLPGLEGTLGILAAGEVDPWARLLFFLTEHDDMAGPRPLDALRLGDEAGVARAARRYAGVAAPASDR